MANTDQYTLAQVLDAIKGSAGIKATIMRRLGCQSRNTVDNYLKRYATAQQAYEEELASVGDAAESVVVRAISNNDVETAKWYLVKKHRDRGYGDVSKTEIGGINGGAIEIRHVTDLTDEELAAIAARGSGGTATP